MTRINLIDPKYLTDAHLIAEYRELPRIFTLVLKNPKLNNIPDNYTLGKGHMNFFKDKLKYLQERQNNLIREMINRGFNPQFKIDISTSNIVNKRMYWGDFNPKKEDITIIKKRLLEKVKLKPDFYRYYGKKITYKDYKEILEVIK